MSPRSYRRPAEHPAKHSSSFRCPLLKQVDRPRRRPPTPPEGVRDPLPVVDLMVSCSLPATTVPASPPPYCISSRRCFMSSLVCKTVSCNFPSQVFGVAASFRFCLTFVPVRVHKYGTAATTALDTERSLRPSVPVTWEFELDRRAIVVARCLR